MPTGTFDTYSPFMAAAIIMDPDDPSSRVPLWTDLESWAVKNDASPKVHQLLQKDIHALSYVTEMSVELQLAFLPIISVTLTPPYRDAIAFLDSPLIEWCRSVLEVRFGYAGGAPEGAVLSPVFSGHILKPDVSLGPDCTITLKAQGIGAFSAVRQQQLQQFDNKTRREIITELVRGPDPNNPRALKVDFSAIDKGERYQKGALQLAENRKALAEAKPAINKNYETSVQAIEASKLSRKEKNRQITRLAQQSNDAYFKKVDVIYRTTYHPIDERLPSLSQAGMTDQMIIWRLVREAGCWMRYVGDTLYVFDKSLATTQPPKYILRLYDFADGSIGPAAGVFPILSVSSPTPAVYLPSEVRGFVLKGIDPETREEKKRIVDDKTAAPAHTGNAAVTPPASKQLPGANKETGDGYALASQDSQPKTGEEQFKQLIEAEMTACQATMMGVKLDIETLGIPDLLPGDVVAVRGIGKRLASESGNFGVMKVTHSIGGSSYTTRLEVNSNTAELAMKIAAGLLPVGPINTSRPEDPKTSDANKSAGRTVQPKQER